MNFFNTKIKPNITEYKDEELIEIIKKNNESTDTNNLPRDLMILKVKEIWDNLILGPDVDCPICLENITNSDNMITNCGHYFHSSCMIKYIVKSKSNNLICCPKCRTNIYSEDVTTINNTNNNNNNENNENNQMISNSDSDSDSDSNSDSGSGSESDPLDNSSRIYQNHTSGINSTVLNYFRGSNIPIDIVSGLWTNHTINNMIQNTTVNQTNLNTDDTDSDEELKKIIFY
jgi:hypothetical protein